MKRRHFLATAAALVVLMPLLANAADLSLSAGPHNMTRNENTAALDVQIRSGVGLYGIRPLAGIMYSAKEELYLYAGINTDIDLGSSFVLTPSAAAGFYDRGNGRDLGYPLEFRLAAELAYIFQSKTRLIISAGHISNAYIGDRNVGTEFLRIGFSVPLE